MMKQKTQQSDKMKKKIPLIETKLSKADFAGKSKQPLKKDLILQLNDLQDRYNTLEEENMFLKTKNNENLENIKELERKIESFKREKQNITKETQTERGIELKCRECNFEALTNTELSWHLSEIHGWSDDQKNDELDMEAGPRYCNKCEFEAADGYELDAHVWSEHDDDEIVDESIVCQYCDQSFSELKYFMAHKKIEHVEKVSVCWNFTDGSCIYGEQKCWFRHEECHNKPDEKTIICRICGETFLSIGLFMKHKKSEHIENVNFCTKYKEGNCTYSEKCWFIHEHEDLSKEGNVNHDKTIEKLVGIVEKFTKKVVTIEDIVMKK